MIVYVLNIGNTNTQHGVFQDGEFRDLKKNPTSQIAPDILPHGMPVAAASVVPSATDKFTDFDIFWIQITNSKGLDLSLVNGSILGADRLANAIALAETLPLPATVLDCGTAITIDVVDQNKVFRGGAIIPGRQMQRKALNQSTAQLPLIAMQNQKPSALGADTEQAILAGTDFALLGSVKELLTGIQDELGGKLKRVIATGGDAEYFVENIPEISQIEADFTLRGIVKAWELNQHES